jgi:hypothetical protein
VFPGQDLIALLVAKISCDDYDRWAIWILRSIVSVQCFGEGEDSHVLGCGLIKGRICVELAKSNASNLCDLRFELGGTAADDIAELITGSAIFPELLCVGQFGAPQFHFLSIVM